MCNYKIDLIIDNIEKNTVLLLLIRVECVRNYNDHQLFLPLSKHPPPLIKGKNGTIVGSAMKQCLLF